MKLTEALKKWLVDNGLAKADADDDEFRNAAGMALANGTLTNDKFVELTKDPDVERADAFSAKMDEVLDAVKKTNDRIDAIETRATETPTVPSNNETEETTERKDTVSTFNKMFAGSGAEQSGAPVVDVIGAHERYDASRTELRYPDVTTKGVVHPFGGQRVFEGNANGKKRFIDTPSDLDQAIGGAYIKWCIRCEKGSDAGIPQCMRMTEHDRDLIQYALREMKWGGVIRGEGIEDQGAIGVKDRRLTEMEIKAVLDDVTSGGVEIAPIVFDDAIIQTPLLFGEFYPRVNTVNITQGRRIEGGTIGNVTLTSGGADGTAIPLFSTASFIAEFNTDIFVANGSIEIGLDFLSDSPVDVAGIVSAQYGQVLLAWLDEQVCVGDGTTEPEGITNATGTTTVNAANGAGGPPTVGDYEGLLFGVAKNYKQGYPANRQTFAGTETSYSRARGIAVGTTDARRVFGMTHEDYMLLGHPYGVGEFFTNRQILFVNWGRYRMYRRLGLTVKVTTEGKELVRNNLLLITARARYGGQLEDGSAAAVMADAQS